MNDLFEATHRPILVVEDSEDDFDTVLQVVARQGITNRILHAHDVDSARQFLPPEGAVEPFAMILLDQNLPGLNGYDLLRQLRSEPLYRTLPVVFYTTSLNPHDRDACHQAGANAYHVKSVRFDECLHTLGEIFNYWLKSAILPAAQHMGAPKPGPQL